MNQTSRQKANAQCIKNILLIVGFIICSLCLVLLHRNTKLIRQLQRKVDTVCVANITAESDGVKLGDDANYLLEYKKESYDQSTKSRYLNVKGAKGDGITDDTKAIQRALNQAAKNKKDAVVLLQKGRFLITKTLILKGGVTLRGQGYGSSPLAIQFDAGGTFIMYCGTEFAIQVRGHSAAIESLAVYDSKYPEGSECENTKGAGGVLVYADNRLVESFTMRNVLIYYFTEGTALKLHATNGGGVFYSSVENIRIRHAKIGIHLDAMEEGDVVNNNHFHDGAISGGITDVGLLVTGPGACNANHFNGMSIGPPLTSIAHVYVSGSKTNVVLNRVRLEGTEMTTPLVIVEDDSYDNVMNGVLGHTGIQADLNRNPEITFLTNKMAGIHPAPSNLFWNAPFHGINSEDSSSIPGWKFTGSDFTVNIVSSSEEPMLYADHNIISIEKGTLDTLKLAPSELSSSPIHSFCTFGIYAKSDTANSISAAMTFKSGSIISSSRHSGSGNWEFIGMSSLFDKMNGPNPFFSLKEDVMVTAPFFSYGRSPAKPGAEFLSGSGK